MNAGKYRHTNSPRTPLERARKIPNNVAVGESDNEHTAPHQARTTSMSPRRPPQSERRVTPKLWGQLSPARTEVCSDASHITTQAPEHIPDAATGRYLCRTGAKGSRSTTKSSHAPSSTKAGACAGRPNIHEHSNMLH